MSHVNHGVVVTLVLLAPLIGLMATPAEAQHCSATSTGNVPLTDLGIGTYNGFLGGLYPNGSNVRPAAHETAGLTMADTIQPLDAAGQIDTLNGRIGFVSIGMSLTNQEFEVFEYASAADPLRDPHITTVNGAQDGHSAFQWADPDHVSWSVLASAVASRGLTAAQVQVAWIKQTVRGSDVGGWSAYPPFPEPALLFQTKLRELIQLLKDRYPNIRIAYLSSRIYGQYAISTNYPEPIAYEEAFGVRWLIEQQMAGDPALRFTGPDAAAPYLAWGPYLWADGLGSDGVVGGIPGRADGLEYSCADFTSDGLHPSEAGRQKVADQLLHFLQTDTTSRRWYLASDTGEPPPPPPPPGGGASHYVELDGANDVVLVADHDSLSFTTGSQDRPLSFELWIRPDSMASKQNLVSKWLEGPNQEYRFYISSNTLRLDLRDPSAQATVSAYVTASQAGLAGGWHHVAVTYDGRGGATAANGIAIYVDGVSLALTRANHAAYVAMENQTYALRLGHESSAYRQYDGGLDEVRIWSVVRTPAELQAQRTVELAGTEPGLVAYWRFNEGTGTTVADDSPGTLTATLLNGALWAPGGPMQPPPDDTTPPDISNIATSGLTPSGVTITFSTSEPATAWVSYTPGAACPCTDVYSAGVGTSHIVTLTGLLPDTFYVYEAKATDAAGNFTVSPTGSFRTPATPADTTPPTVTITSPAAGTVSGTVTIAATASDNVGVAGVQFTVNGAAAGAEDLAPPYQLSWNTTASPDGPYTIGAVARDAAGNTAAATPVGVTVSNAPPPPPPPPPPGGAAHYVELDGANDVVLVADHDSLSFTTGSQDRPLSFELWIRPDSMAGKQNLVSKWLEGPNQEYRFYISSNTLRLDLRDPSAQATVSAYVTASQAGLAGGWHHVAVTYDGRGGATAANGIAIYVDGVSLALTRANRTTYVAMENQTYALRLGHESSAYRQYNGGLDEVRIWNVARTPAELQAQRTVELAGTEPGLVAYWRFNEGTGTTVADDSPGTLTATLLNGALWVAGGPVSPRP